MALDGGFIKVLARSLCVAQDAHIEKIYQPSHDELVFVLRKPSFSKRLLVSAKTGSARVHFTEERPDNPQTPPMLCTLLRRHLSSARIVGFFTFGTERVIEIRFSAVNEMGDIVPYSLFCELIGAKPNIVFTDGEKRIIDAVRKNGIDSNSRTILAGVKYELPEPSGKLDMTEFEPEILAREVLKNENSSLSRAVLSAIGGVSPLVAREISYKALGDTEYPVRDIAESGTKKLTDVISAVRFAALNGQKTYILTEQNLSINDFSYIPIEQYGKNCLSTPYETPSETLEIFYRERAAAERLARLGSDTVKLVSNLISRAEKRAAARRQDLLRCEEKEKYRLYGELIKANIYAVRPGAEFVRVQNYYEEDLREINIPLDPALSVSANAAKYFKEYKKAHTARQHLGELIEKDIAEQKYLESVADLLSRVQSAADIAEIKAELVSQGYIRERNRKNNRVQPAVFKEYLTPSGFKLLVGKSNTGNDQLTLKVAAKNDTWFHVKDTAGSHAVIINGGKELTKDDIIFAAKTAAKNSKAAESSNVPVDYTMAKFVKKPSGARAGMVIYTNYSTVFVTPDK